MHIYDDLTGLIIVHPHGTYIASGEKTLIIKSRKFAHIANRPLLLIQDHEILAVIWLDDYTAIDLRKFESLRSQHMITDEERVKWWPAKIELYMYPVIKKQVLASGMPIAYPNGPQVVVKLQNIRKLQPVFIGTSGYMYKWWIQYYEYTYKPEDRFAIYSRDFASLEINGSFYKYYDADVWKRLAATSPHDFAFSVKVNRGITHYYQYQKFPEFLKNVRHLKSKLHCLLFQFSERFLFNDKNMAHLQSLQTGSTRCAFEFRHIDWFNDRVYDLFRTKKHWTVTVSYYGYDNTHLANGFNPDFSNWISTSNFMYVRMHGTTGKYTGSHHRILPHLARFIRENKIKRAYVYFNNTDSLHNSHVSNAIVDAKYLQQLTGEVW